MSRPGAGVAGQIGALRERLAAQVRMQGAAGTARTVAGQLRATVTTDEEHIWYALDLALPRPALPLPPGLVVRRGADADIALIDRIPPVSAFQARRRLRDGADLWLALDGVEVAFLCWVLYGRAPSLAAPGGFLALPAGVGNLEDSVAPPGYRGRGVGPAVVLTVFDRLQAEGLGSVITRITVDNTASRRASAKVGFAEVATVALHRRGTRSVRSVQPAAGQEASWLVAAYGGRTGH